MKRLSKLLSVVLAVAMSLPSFGAGYQIKQSTTAYPLVFMMVDSTDHVSGKTGLTPTVTISKAGAAFAAPSGAVTEIANGWYKVAGNATDAGTLGPLVLHATGTAADATDAMFEVVAYDPQDAVRFGISALPNAAVDTIGGLQSGRQGPRTWYISSVGNDSNSGLDQTLPLLTTSQALTNCSNGDTIVLLNSITTASFAPTKQITLQSAKPAPSLALTISGGGGIAPTVGGLVVRNLKVVNSFVGGTGAAFQPSNGAFGFTFDTVELDGGDGYAAVLDNNQGVVFRNVYAHSTGQFAINAQEASNGAGGRTTLRLVDTVVSGARAAIHVDDRVSVFAENGQLLTNYTGATYKSVGSVLFDVHYNPGGTFYGRNNYMNAATTSGSYAGDTALINTWVADGGTPGDGTDTAAVSAIVEGGYGVASKTAGTLHHFAARPAGSNLRVFGVNHDATKNTGFVQVLDGLVDWANIVNKTNSNVFTNTTLAAGTLTTGERTSIASALLGTTNGAANVGTQLQSASTAGDPLGNAVPGAYGAGTAGYVIGRQIGGPIERRKVADARKLVVKARTDGTFGVNGRIRMSPGEQSLWGLEFDAQLPAGHDLFGAASPVIGGANAAHMTTIAYGFDGREAKAELNLSSSATTADVITVQYPVQISATETIIVNVAVTVGQ